MKIVVRRILLGTGAALLVGGWGVIRFALHDDAGPPRRAPTWVQGRGRPVYKPGTEEVDHWEYGPSARVIFASGVVTMVVAAALIGVGVLPSAGDKDNGG